METSQVLLTLLIGIAGNFIAALLWSWWTGRQQRRK